MAKRKQDERQLSLFDDSFFEATTKQETENKERPLSKKEAFYKEMQDWARKEMEEAEKTGNIIQIKIPIDNFFGKKEPEKKTEKKIRIREKRQRLRISFPDGTKICNKSATQTMIDAIRKIGTENVAQLNMEVCHIPLVAQEINPRYAQWTKKIDDKWFLMAQSDTRQKYMQMASIIKQLGIDVKVELGDFESMETPGTVKTDTKKKRKAQMEVVLADGNIVRNSDPMHTFKDIVELIGVDKVKRTNLNVGRFPIVSRDKKANNQIELNTGEWLTVPNLIKDKYKVLRVLSSMTHTPMEIKIIE